MTAYVSALAVTAVLLYGGQMLLAFGMYGAGNMSLPLASLSEFRDCPYEISIAQYAWFYLGVKVMGVVLFGGFAMALLTGCRKYGAAVCLYFLIIVLEYLLYVRMDSASPFNGLKYLNLAAVLDAKAWFSTYRNLNVFSHPLSVMPGKLIFAGICAVVTTVLAAWGFCRRTQQRSLPGWNACMEQVQKGMARLPRPGAHGTLFLHEGFKLYLPYYWAIWEDLVRVDTGLWLRGVMGYERFEYSISIGQAFGMMVGIRYLTAVSCGMIAAGTAKLVHHPAVGSAVCFLLFLAPCFLYLMGVDLSGWTCVGGFLPQLVYRNGGTLAYLGKLGILLGIDGMVGVFLLRERGRRI